MEGMLPFDNYAKISAPQVLSSCKQNIPEDSSRVRSDYLIRWSIVAASMGKQGLFLLTRGVDCTADRRVTRTYFESRSLKELIHSPSVRHWVRQWMIGNFCGHRGRRP
jgi:hypothetical protein